MEGRGLEIEMWSALIVHVFTYADINENVVALN
jgi:hypothetical protein